MRKETCCCHIGYSYRLTARVLLYAPSHRQDNTYHSLCYTSRGTRNSSMGPANEGSIRRPITPWANALTTELRLTPTYGKGPLRKSEKKPAAATTWVSLFWLDHCQGLISVWPNISQAGTTTKTLTIKHVLMSVFRHRPVTSGPITQLIQCLCVGLCFFSCRLV